MRKIFSLFKNNNSFQQLVALTFSIIIISLLLISALVCVFTLTEKMDDLAAFLAAMEEENIVLQQQNLMLTAELAICKKSIVSILSVYDFAYVGIMLSATATLYLIYTYYEYVI